MAKKKTTPAQASSGNTAAATATVQEIEAKRGRKAFTVAKNSPLLDKDGKLAKNPATHGLNGEPVSETNVAAFDFKAHKPIKKKSFAATADFFDYKASQFDHMAAAMRNEATLSRSAPDGEGRGKAKKLEKMAGKMAELQALCAAKGIDVAAILARAQEEAKKKLAAAGAPATAK